MKRMRLVDADALRESIKEMLRDEDTQNDYYACGYWCGVNRAIGKIDSASTVSEMADREFALYKLTGQPTADLIKMLENGWKLLPPDDPFKLSWWELLIIHAREAFNFIFGDGNK